MKTILGCRRPNPGSPPSRSMEFSTFSPLGAGLHEASGAKMIINTICGLLRPCYRLLLGFTRTCSPVRNLSIGPLLPGFGGFSPLTPCFDDFLSGFFEQPPYSVGRPEQSQALATQLDLQG